MIRLVNIEEIQNLMQFSSKLIDMMSDRDVKFIDEVNLWLIKIEEVLANNKLPESSKIASLRGEVISAKMGISPLNLQTNNLTKSKLRNSIALNATNQTIAILFDVFQKDIDRINEAERIMNQLIAVSKLKGILNDFPDSSITTDVLKSFWKRFSSDSDLSQGVVSVEGLVGPYDSLIIFDRLVKFHL